MGWAGLAVLLYALLCWRAWRQARTRLPVPVQAASEAAWHVVFASQTGSAEMLARQTAHTLVDAGHAAVCLPLGRLTPALLERGGRFLFLVSTAGEGGAPDDAQHFVRRCLAQPLDLAAVNYALLALGDRTYPCFNAFGRRLDHWLQASGASCLVPRIELDRCDAEGVAAWRALLERCTGAEAEGRWGPAPATAWRLQARTCLNPGSQGAPVYRLCFAACEDGVAWHAGDLVEITLPGDDLRPRAFSIASMPAEGGLHLLVRLHYRPDGTPGTVSHHLAHTIQPGDVLPLSVRAHPGFRLGANAHRPLILIGSGVGLAGLRAHLVVRMADGQRENWLVFGERNRGVDDLHAPDLAHWQAVAGLARLDVVYSRESGALRYVQDVLRQSEAALTDWLERGAAIYVCGSRHGMGEGVHQALLDMLGEAALASLIEEGRYCRDLF